DASINMMTTAYQHVDPGTFTVTTLWHGQSALLPADKWSNISGSALRAKGKLFVIRKPSSNLNHGFTGTKKRPRA
ncbi:hypothetical protein PZ02_11755, partial [Lacticaseibacillus rhamnosus]